MKQKLLVAVLAVLSACFCLFGIVGCDSSETGENENPGGHTHTMAYHKEIAATCTENGNIAYWSCEGCGKYFSDEAGQTEIADKDSVVVKAAGHVYGDWVTKKESSCTEQGERERICSVCKNSEKEALPLAAHSYGEWVKDDTHHWHKCENCGDIADRTEHSWDAGEITKQASCKETGIMTYTCTDCSQTKTEDIPLSAHVYGEWMTKRESSCTEQGERERICSVCQKSETEALPLAAHSYGGWVKDDTYHWHKCENCGEIAEKDKHVLKEEVCSVCSYGTPTAGLTYRLSDDRTYYIVTGLEETEETQIFIPAVYQQLPVKEIGNSAFSGSGDLTWIRIPTGVTKIGTKAFSGCKKLTNIQIPSSVAEIGMEAFYGCTGLEEVTFEGESLLTSVKNKAFYNCSALSAISLPAKVTEIGEYAFYGCKALTGIALPASVQTIGNNVFKGCSGLKSVAFAENSQLESIGESAFSACSGLTDVSVPSGVQTIGKSAFAGCTKLKSMALPFVGDSVKSNKDLYQYPFGYLFGWEYTAASGLREVRQTYYESSTSSTVTRDFYIPDSLREVTIAGGEILYGAFMNCKMLTSVVIPAGATSIGENAFFNCTLLSSFTVPSGVKKIGATAFNYCRALSKLTVPSSLNTVGKGAFSNCSKLTSVYYEGDVAGWCRIAGLEHLKSSRTLYMNGAKLTGELVIPSHVFNIPAYAFYGCSGLTSVTISSSVTTIGGYAFYNCSGLTSVTISPTSGLKTIEDWAFYKCDKINTLFFGGTSRKWDFEVSKGNYNPLISLNVKRYFYSMGEPPLNEEGTGYDGLYWHYGNDGKTPVIWKKEGV